MNLQESFDYLQFWINKKTGAWYTISELELLVDRGSISLFSDMRPEYARSQVVKDALANFRKEYPFSPSTTISGVISVPSNLDFLSLLDIRITFNISNREIFYSVPMVNEDELSDRLNSQLNPVTVTSPVGEVLAPRFYKLYPVGSPGYTGRVVYFKRPDKPVFAYSVISERVIVFNEEASTNLNWPEDFQNRVLIKALSSIGINLSAAEIANYAQMKTQDNFNSVNIL